MSRTEFDRRFVDEGACAATSRNSGGRTALLAPPAIRAKVGSLRPSRSHGNVPVATARPRSRPGRSCTGHDPILNHGIPNVGILQIIGAVELDEVGRPCRVRLEPLENRTGPGVRGFVERNVELGATVVSDGFPGYRKLAEHRTHVGKVVGKMAAHVLLPWMHRAFSNLKRWFIGTLHGVRKQHLRYLDEFTFRWNRRRHTRMAFDSLLGLVARLEHASMLDFVEQRV